MSEQMSAAEFRKRVVNTGKWVTLSGKPKPEKKSKYASEITVVDSIKFRSKKEAKYYEKLKLLKDAGEITEIELQPRFPYRLIYTLQKPDSPIVEKKETYVADFRITFADGRVEIIDTKGYMTPVAKRKIEVAEKLFNIKVKIV